MTVTKRNESINTAAVRKPLKFSSFKELSVLQQQGTDQLSSQGDRMYEKEKSTCLH